MPQGMYWAYPQPPANIQTGDLIINSPIGRDVRKYSYRDDMRTWQGFLFTTKKINGVEYILTPVEFAWSEDIINKYVTRDINLATSDGKLALNRPVGKKAYLHGISYSLYDYHQLVPRYLEPNECPNNQQYHTAYYPQINENLYSVIIAKKAYPSQNDDFLYITNLNLQGNKNYMTYDYGTPFKLNAANFRDMHTLFDLNYSNKTAPRSNVLWGMLPMDWYHNHFDIQIIGVDNNTNVKYIWHNKGYVDINDSNTTNHSFATLNEEIVPQIFNEINKPIDDDIDQLLLKVKYPYIYVPLKVDEDYLPGISGIALPMGNYTIFKLPVKIELSILYY